jgi:hypothetical protein
MTVHLGGPETAQQLEKRHLRYCRSTETGVDPMFVIVVGPERLPAGLIGYWKIEIYEGRGQQRLFYLNRESIDFPCCFLN